MWPIAMFSSENVAKHFFGPEIPVERCEACGFWSSSRADHDEGGIVGSYCDEGGTKTILDRVCHYCEATIEMCPDCNIMMSRVYMEGGRLSHWKCKKCRYIQDM